MVIWGSFWASLVEAFGAWRFRNLVVRVFFLWVYGLPCFTYVLPIGSTVGSLGWRISGDFYFFGPGEATQVTGTALSCTRVCLMSFLAEMGEGKVQENPGFA